MAMALAPPETGSALSFARCVYRKIVPSLQEWMEITDYSAPLLIGRFRTAYEQSFGVVISNSELVKFVCEGWIAPNEAAAGGKSQWWVPSGFMLGSELNWVVVLLNNLDIVVTEEVISGSPRPCFAL